MKTLINAVEEWIDLRIFASSKNAIFEAKFNEMAVTLERADRISHSAFVDVQDLTKEFKATEELHIRDANRIAELERRVMSLDEDNSFNNVDANIIDIEERIEDIESRLESVEGEVDIEEIAQNVHDNVESFIIDAVRTEIDAIDFKVTVER